MAKWEQDPLITQLKARSFAQPSDGRWEQDPLITQPSGGRWEQDSLVTEQADSLIKRYGKQVANAFARIPEQMAESTLKAIALGIPSKEKLIGLIPEPEPVLPTFTIPPPETWKEKGIDIAAGVTATVAQIAALRKILPAGTSQPIVWEVQNQMTGGTPGMGALYGGVVSGVGKLPASELAKATAEAVGFYSLARIEGAEPEEALTGAAVPVALRGAGALYRTARRGLRPRPGVVEPQVITRGKEARMAREIAGIRGLGKLPGIIKPIKPQTKQPWAATVYRGAGKRLQKHGYVTDPGDLGAGEYWTTSQSTAVKYGPQLKQQNIIVKNPLVINSKQAAKLADTILNPLLQKDHVRRAQRASQYLKSKGYDAVIVEGYDSPPGEYTISLLNPQAAMKAAVGVRELGKLPPATLESTNQKISEWSGKAKVLRETEVKKVLHEFRKEQAIRGAERTEIEVDRATMKGAPAPTWTGIVRSKGGYKGKAPVPEMTPLNLSPAEKEVIAKKTMELYPTAAKQFKRTNTITAFDKMTHGKIPADFEFELIEPVLGVGKTIELYKRLRPAPSLTLWDIPRVIWTSAKFIVGGDIQPVRQLSHYSALEPRLYGKQIITSARAYVDPTFSKDELAKIVADPRHKQALKYGVNFYGMTPYSRKGIGRRPEWVMGQIPEKMKEIGLKRGRPMKTVTTPLRLYGRLLSASERSNVVGVNGFQQRLWNKGAEQLELTAKSPKQLDRWLKHFAKLLNRNSKILQAKNPSAREIQRAANWFVFSPSMTAGRPLSIASIFTAEGSRLYAGRLLASNVGKIVIWSTMIHQIGKWFGIDIDSDINPLSSDWGKARTGDTHFDPHLGDMQFYRTLVRLAVSAYINTVGGGFPTKVGKWRVQTPLEIVSQYAKTRETAAIGFIQQLFTGRDFFGEEIPRWEVLIRGWTPQIATDFYDALMADGTIIALLAGGTAALSGGVMTYPQSAWQKEQEFRNKIARAAHRQDWENLSSIQQRVLRLKNRAQFKEFELQKKQERKLRPAEISLEEQRKAGQWVQKQLSKTHQNIINESGVSMNISRTIGDWWLNDKRYKQYRNLTAFYLTQELNKLEKNPAWLAKRDSRFVQVAVNIARMKARMRVRKL